jgi:hypothetical protein
MMPIQMNTNLYDLSGFQLKSDIRKNIDFEYISEGCFRLFEEFWLNVLTRLQFN